MRASYFNTVFFISITIFGCTSKDRRAAVGIANFTDTIYKTEVSFFENGDTLRQYYTYYFKPTDLSLDTSNFFYTACKTPCSKEEIYKVYFPRKQVVSFCDSMLKTFPPNPNNEWDEYFNTRVVYKKIREDAAENKTGDGVYYGEIVILIDRFRPFIVNLLNNDKPKYVIVQNEDNQPGGEYRNYLFKTHAGDTVYIDGMTLRPIPIKVD